MTDKMGAELDQIQVQWKKERPEIDASVMALCGALYRKSEKIKQAIQDNIKAYNLDFPAFDVLMTLRRNGKGVRLTPSELSREMMMSTSAMTNRLDRLEKRDLILRESDPNDRRSLKISLTDEGFSLIDGIVESHVAVEEAVLAPLSLRERDQLMALLKRLDV